MKIFISFCHSLFFPLKLLQKRQTAKAKCKCRHCTAYLTESVKVVIIRPTKLKVRRSSLYRLPTWKYKGRHYTAYQLESIKVVIIRPTIWKCKGRHYTPHQTESVKVVIIRPTKPKAALVISWWWISQRCFFWQNLSVKDRLLASDGWAQIKAEA